MNRYITFFTLGLSLIISTSNISALPLDRIALFGLGFAAGTTFHEIGHAVSGLAVGGKITDFGFQHVNIKLDPPSLSHNRKIALSGYIASSIATEFILQTPQFHTHDFALGWMSLSLVTNLTNPIQYYLFKQTHNDLRIYKQNGGDPLIPSLFMLAHAVYTLYRITHNTDIPFHLTSNTFQWNHTI